MKRGILRQLWELRGLFAAYAITAIVAVALTAAKIAGAAEIIKWIWG